MKIRRSIMNKRNKRSNRRIEERQKSKRKIRVKRHLDLEVSSQKLNLRQGENKARKLGKLT